MEPCFILSFKSTRPQVRCVLIGRRMQHLMRGAQGGCDVLQVELLVWKDLLQLGLTYGETMCKTWEKRL